MSTSIRQAFLNPTRNRDRRYHCTKVLVMPGTEPVLPFAIVLPEDCLNVESLVVTNTSTIVIGLGDTPNGLFDGPIGNALRNVKAKMIREGHVPNTIEYSVDGAPQSPITIAKYALGTVNIKRLAKPVYSQVLLPLSYQLNYRNDDIGRAETHYLAIPNLTKPTGHFIELGGLPTNTRELQGWLDLNEIAVRNHPINGEDLYIDYTLPFEVSITVAYQTSL